MADDGYIYYRERGPGTCDDCGKPVYYPQFRRPGFMGCQCAVPNLWTWEMMDNDTWEPPERIERPGMCRPSNFSIWKKRAKNL